MSLGVMIVDDDPDMLVLVQAVIEEANEGLFVTGAVASGEEALQRLVECDPDVVILDQAMAGMTGLETAGRMREQRPAQEMIMFTAYLTADLAQQAAEAGIAHCRGKGDLMQLPDLLRSMQD